MAEDMPARVKMAQRLSGELITLHGRTLQPVAQASGWRWGGERQPQGFAGALLRVQPLHLVVREGESVRIIPLVNPDSNRLQAMALPAIMVALSCLLVIFLARRIAARK
jgi:hypothetical protein